MQARERRSLEYRYEQFLRQPQREDREQHHEDQHHSICTQERKDPSDHLRDGHLVVPLTANKFSPTGGITAPISTHNANRMPR